MERVTIIGLGLIGTSIGLALRANRRNNVEVIGYDANTDVHNRSKKTGAVDRAEWNLDRAVRDSDLIVLAVPATACRELFEVLPPMLKDGATVTDTASTKRQVADWAAELLPGKVGYVGGNPLAGSGLSGPTDATVDLFIGARYAIVPPPRAPQESVATVVRMVEDLGAKAFFVDKDEHDSYVAAISHMPAVVSAALVTSLARSPSWGEIGKFGSAEFRDLSRLASVDPELNHGVCATNPDMLTHWLDQIINELSEYRAMIQDKEALAEKGNPLMERFIAGWEARLRWNAGIEPADTPRNELPTASEGMMQMFFGGAVTKRLSRLKDDEARDKNRYRRSN
jgi:prephenate dehydrogenase